jgi:hypothetical protein
VPVLHVACVRLHAIAPTQCELFRRRAGRMRTRSGALSPIPIPAADSRIQDGPSCASRRVGHETRSHADLRDRDRDESSARHKAPGCARIRRPVSARSSAKASYDVVSPKRPKTGPRRQTQARCGPRIRAPTSAPEREGDADTGMCRAFFAARRLSRANSRRRRRGVGCYESRRGRMDRS